MKAATSDSIFKQVEKLVKSSQAVFRYSVTADQGIITECAGACDGHFEVEISHIAERDVLLEVRRSTDTALDNIISYKADGADEMGFFLCLMDYIEEGSATNGTMEAFLNAKF